MRATIIGCVTIFAAGLAGCAVMERQAAAPGYETPRPVEFSASNALAWLNAYRGQHGLSAVRLDPSLTALAQRQADVMARRDKLSHTVDASIASRVESANIQGRGGENILYGAYTTEGAMRQWQASAGHDKNLRLKGATRFGIAWAQSYGPKRRAYWAMMIATDPPPQPQVMEGPFAMAPAPGETVISGSIPTVRYRN